MGIVFYIKAILFLATSGYAFAEWGRKNFYLSILAGGLCLVSGGFLIIEIEQSFSDRKRAQNLTFETGVQLTETERMCASEWQRIDREQLPQLKLFIKRCRNATEANYAEVMISQLEKDQLEQIQKEEQQVRKEAERNRQKAETVKNPSSPRLTTPAPNPIREIMLADLVGGWSGRYRGGGSATFDLELDMYASTCSGNIVEPRTFGSNSCGNSLYAKVSQCQIRSRGQKREFEFVKKYDNSCGVNHSVKYVGEIKRQTPTKLSVIGKWKIGGRSGSFQMSQN